MPGKYFIFHLGLKIVLKIDFMGQLEKWQGESTKYTNKKK